MFPEYRELISKLKNTDNYFERLFNAHNNLDHKIDRISTGIDYASRTDLENLKKEKLKLKDGMYAYLKKIESTRV